MPKPPLDKDAFAAAVIERIKLRGETRELVYDAKEFRIGLADGNALRLNLHNVYKTYSDAAEQDRPLVIARAAVGWRLPEDELELGYESIAPDLYPAIRSRSYFELLRLEAELEGRGVCDVAFVELAEHLCVALVHDEPHTMRFITQDDIAMWGINIYEAFEQARRNLELAPIHYAELGKCYAINSNDGYDSARLLMTDMVRQFDVAGDYIAMAPSRDLLLLTGANDPAGLKAMVELAREALRNRPVSGLAFHLDGDTWAPWLPAVEHPSYRDFHELQLDTFGVDYTDQAQLLERLYEQREEAVFVAQFGMIDQSDCGFSIAVWTRDVIADLPRVEFLAFVGDEETIIRDVPWEQAVEIVGHLMVEQPIYPVRYRVDEFPSPDELRRLQAVAVRH